MQCAANKADKSTFAARRVSSGFFFAVLGSIPQFDDPRQQEIEGSTARAADVGSAGQASQSRDRKMVTDRVARGEGGSQKSPKRWISDEGEQY
jgi:hypothetical protein